jgi:hypothetical protein
MRRRKRLKLLAAVVVVLAAGTTLALWPRPDRITRASYERIREGMSRADVEAVLGPPGDYRTGPTTPEYSLSGGQEGWNTGNGPALITFGDAAEWREPEGMLTCKWHGDRRVIRVTFDPDGRAVDAMLSEGVKRLDQAPLENIVWRAKRQWQKWFPER